jgi:hypothetical protein
MIKRKKKRPKKKRALEGTVNPRRLEIQYKISVQTDNNRKRLPVAIHNRAYLSFKYFLRTSSKITSRRQLDPIMANRVTLMFIPVCL